MQDINEIKKELIGFEEIELPYQLNHNCYIKYITLENDQEFFFTGGYYLKMGLDKIILKKNNHIISVPTVYQNKCGEVLYRSRFFITEKEQECLKDKKELEKIIQTQQYVIEKMTKKLEKAIHLLNKENKNV
jgi:hypothetical protein